MIKGLGHVCFYVTDIDRTHRFYTEVMGMQHSFDICNPRGERYGFMLHSGGPAWLEIFRGEYVPDALSSFKHICIETNDIYKTVDDLRSKSVEVTDAKVSKDGSLNAFLKDPDGNIIELMEYTIQSKQTTHLR